MVKLIEKYPYVSIFASVFLMLGFTIDAIPVSIMEARNFISAREMLTDDNWLLTTMNGEPRYQKPPLPTWITAVFAKLFGITNVLALRWPALIMVASIGISIYNFSLKIANNKSHSLITGCIAITSFYIIGITIEAPWDIYAHGFMLLGLYQLFIMLHDSSISLRRSFIFVLCVIASVLSKGPVSLYVLFLSFAIAYGIAYGYQRFKLYYLKILGLLLLAIALGATWYIYVRISDPETFAKIAIKETSNWGSYNVRPFYYYWSFFTQSGLWTIPAFISLLYPYMKNRVSNIKAYRFSFFWTVIAVVLLSIIPEKKSRYLMPVLIPLSLNIGFYINYLISEFKTLKSKKETFPVYFNFGLIGTIALLSAVLLTLFVGDYFEDIPVLRLMLLSIASAGIGVFIFKNLIYKNIKTTVYLCVMFVIALGCIGMPLLKQTKKAENYRPISGISYEKENVYALNYVSPEMLYNYGDKIPQLNLKYVKSNNENAFYLICHDCSSSDFDKFEDEYYVDIIGKFDLNRINKDARSYNDRLVNTVAFLTQK